jgi:hypothetical protein
LLPKSLWATSTLAVCSESCSLHTGSSIPQKQLWQMCYPTSSQLLTVATLRSYRCMVLEWFTSYLSNRQQRVQHSSHTFTTTTLTCGGPSRVSPRPHPTFSINKCDKQHRESTSKSVHASSDVYAMAPASYGYGGSAALRVSNPIRTPCEDNWLLHYHGRRCGQ